MKVTVNFPKIENDTVTFSWHTDKDVPFFKKEDFYIKYEGLNIENMPKEIFWNAFLALMVPIYKLSQEEVVFIFPKSISEFIAETWINYHSAGNIIVLPLYENTSVELYKNNISSKGLNSKIGILFGGGKDSTYSFSVLSELYGMENTVLISYVYPTNINSINKVDLRREKFILKNLRKDFNVKIQKVITDFLGTVAKPEYSYAPHIAIYTGTILPVILKYNLTILTHNTEFLDYATGNFNSTKINFHHIRSRPEYSNYISTRTNSFFNTNVSIINLSYFLSETAAFKILVKGYPNIFKYIMMCESTSSLDTKWCLNCRKCCEYVLYSLCYDNKNPEIDYDYFFTKSPFISKIINSNADLKSLDNENSNYPWSPELGSPYHYESFCHVLASINQEEVSKKVSEKGFQNFMVLKNRYGNIKYPIYEGFIEPAFKKLNPPLIKRFQEIVTKYCPPIKEPPEFLYIGNNKVTIDYTLNCHINQIFNKEHFKAVSNELFNKKI